MVMKIKLREWANLPEETVLRWLNTRRWVEVTDDLDQVALTDTYALIITWHGMIIHRHYNDVPYSIKEMVPSNKVEGGEDTVYNDGTNATPINQFLKVILPTIIDPVEVDGIKRLIYIWQNKLNNLLVVMSERYVISATAESVAEFMEDEGISGIRDRVLSKEISIDEGEREFADYVRTSHSIANNTLTLLSRTGGVAINQAYQKTIIRGKVFDLNNSIMPNAITVPYAHGITNLADMLGERNAAGKAGVLSSKIKIPGGWKTMGNIRVGDEVVTPDGGTAKVLAVHPQGVTKVVRVHFKDGRYTDVSPDHLWKVRRHHWCNDKAMAKLTREEVEERVWRVITTNELKDYIGLSTKVYVQLIEPERNADKPFKIHPYVLGVLLGDGCISQKAVDITKPYQQLFDKVQSLLPEHLECVWRSNGDKEPKTFAIRFKDHVGGPLNKWHIRDGLKELGLYGMRSWEKVIPEEYLHGSAKQRLELLQGLLDTDGTVDKHKSVSFSSSSKLLSLGVQYLVRSLGGMARLQERTPHYTHNGEKREGRTDYRVYIRYPRPEELFTLDHKRERAVSHQHTETLRLQVTHIEERPDEETQCITIDHPDHLYITDDFIVTHNSLTNNGKALKSSEWFHRKVHILSAVVADIDHFTDCGTTTTVPIRIPNMQAAMALLGKFRVTDTGELELIDQTTVWSIKPGEWVNIRSVAFCNHYNNASPCRVCYGMMASSIPYNVIMKKGANVGMWCATSICNPIGQGMLSTKHFIRNATTRKFVPATKDKNVIYSNGDDIFLTKELCAPGTELVLKADIVNILSDIRSLDVLDNLSLDKLPYFSEVTFRYEVEDIMMGGKTLQQHAACTSVSSRNARFSLEFLNYLLSKGWANEGKKHITVDLSEWNTLSPIFTLPYVREDLDMHRARVENFITFNKRNNAWRQQIVTPRLFGEVLAEYWGLINQETKGINIIHPEVLLYSTLCRDPMRGDYSLANGNGPKYFVNFQECIKGRGAGMLMIYENQQNVLSDPKTFRVVNRQGSPLECFFSLAVS